MDNVGVGEEEQQEYVNERKMWTVPGRRRHMVQPGGLLGGWEHVIKQTAMYMVYGTGQHNTPHSIWLNSGHTLWLFVEEYTSVQFAMGVFNYDLLKDYYFFLIRLFLHRFKYLMHVFFFFFFFLLLLQSFAKFKLIQSFILVAG